MHRKNIVIWAPGLFDSTGGIQNYLKSLISALCSISDDIGVYVLSKNDSDRILLEKFNSRVTWFTLDPSLPFRSLTYGLISLIKTFQKQPDLVICGHVNFSEAFYPLTLHPKIKSWVICYGIECWRVNGFFKKKLLKSVTRTISISNYTRSQLIKSELINPDTSEVLPVTFDEDRFVISQDDGAMIRKKLGISLEDKVILTVARLSSKERYKGYDKVIEIFPQLLKTFSNLRYVIVGDGDDKVRLSNIIEDLNIKDRVHLTGYIDEKELPAYYNACDVFCMPSKGEGFGIVFLEAMSCGKIVIAGNKDGSKDALCDGMLGFLIDPDNTFELYETLRAVFSRSIPHELVYDPHKLRQRVIEKFGKKAFKNRLKQLLDLQGWNFI